MKQSGQSIAEYALFIGLLVVIVIGLTALVGPTVSQLVGSNAMADVSAQADLNTYHPIDLEETEIDVMLDTYVDNETHGPLKHADVYDEVKSACKNPSHQLWVRPSKRVDICFIEGLGWGFQVWKQTGGGGNKTVWSERTAYIREEIQSYSDLVDFARKNNLILKEYVNGEWVVITQ